MLVILRENVDNLGSIGDLVKVTDGYARNFLIPRNLVAPADEKNVAAIEHHKRGLDKKRKAQMKDSEELAKKLAEAQFNVARKVGEHDKLFGSVTASDVAEAIQKQGFTVEKRQVHIEQPIRALGVHNVDVRLPQGVTTTVKVWVVKEA